MIVSSPSAFAVGSLWVGSVSWGRPWHGGGLLRNRACAGL